MKTKPKQDEMVYWVKFDDLDPIRETQITIHSDVFHCVSQGGYRFNLFRTRSEALKAKREIVKILKGGV